MFKQAKVLVGLMVVVFLMGIVTGEVSAWGRRRKEKEKPVTSGIVESTATTDTSVDDMDVRIDKLVEQISKSMAREKKTKIAVIEFTDLYGNITAFGKYLAEELITKLFQTGKFRVIERQLLNKVVEEQKLSLTQLIDPESAKELGRILGVDAIVSGTITDLVDRLKVNARIIGTETGDIFAVASTAITKDETVVKLLGTIEARPYASEMETTATTPTSGPSGNLVVNGDFEQDLSVGWKKVIDWDPKYVDEAGVNWAKIEPELFGTSNVLHLYHEGISQISLIQEVPVSTTDLEFSVSIKLYALHSGGGSTGAFFWLELQDDTGRLLGDIWWRAGRIEHLKDSPVRRIVVQELRSGGVDIKWKTYNINLRDELSTYMIGVKKERVKKVVLKMLCWSSPCWSSSGHRSELWVDNITLREIK